MTLPDLRALLAAEKADALAGHAAARLSEDRSDAVDYYLGDMSKDMPVPDGRSKAVSTDVADTVEGLMPALMDIFCGSDEVVRFEPVGPDDVQAAEQETDYVNHVFMQQNPGFMVLYGFIKDALLSKVGIVKVWWEAREEEERETYRDQSDEAFGLIVNSPEIDVVEHTQRESADYPGAMVHDVTVVKKKTYACAKAEGVPPEEFGIERNARSMRDANYCFHKVLSTESKLIAQGYDPEQVRNLPSYSYLDTPEEQSRNTVDEDDFAADRMNTAARTIEVVEHYCRMDYEGDGKARLYKITTGGGQEEILRKDGEPDIVPYDVMPFAAMTPIIITHRFFGRSVAELVMDIQRIKTALLRSMLDNAYLANNPRIEISEQHATESTLDDLLVSRPGGVVRTKAPGGLTPIILPNITGQILPLLEYQDATREWRTGVTRQGQGIDANALQNQSATAVNQAFTAAQARMKLIARVFAETGIRDLFSLLHATIRKHGSQPATVRLRNQWVTVDPRNWKTRNDLTVNVGLGTGGKAERIAQLMAVIGMQKEAFAAGLTNLVGPMNLYNSAKELVKLVDLKTVEPYFLDPSQQPEPQPQPDPKIIELQMKNEIEKTQAAADIETQNRKAVAEITLAERKFELERELKILDAQLKREQHQQNMVMSAVKSADRPRQTVKDADGNETVVEDGGGGQMAGLIAMMMDRMEKLAAPKRVVRGPDGRVSHLEPM